MLSLQFKTPIKTLCILSLLLPIVCSYRGKGKLREREWRRQRTTRDLERIANRDPKAYTSYEVLDREGRYILEWIVDFERERILFNVSCQTQGYIGFGLSRNGRMAGADIVIGGILNNGTPYFTDRHGVEDAAPLIDESQDWTLHDAWEHKSWTFLSFSRAFDTCDENDYIINEFDATRLIWAYGEIDQPSQYHFGNRGQYTAYLLDPHIVPLSLKKESFVPGPPPHEVLEKENLQLWTIPLQYRLIPRDTIYLCTIHKFPKIGRKHHIVAFDTRLETPEAIKHVHHILFFRCTPPPNTTAFDFFDRYTRHPGVQCHFPTRPLGDMPTQFCNMIKHGFGIGGRIGTFPNHYGIPVGETLTDEYYMVQVHYDNPDISTDEVRLDMDFYYTDQLRPNDGGLMTVGHQIPANPSILLPPNSIQHNIYGHCGPDCTRTMFPPEGVNVSMVLLHTHWSGQKIRVRHFRGQIELPWVSNDDNYVNTNQAYRILSKESNVLPGDHLTVTCGYDNSWYNGTTVGGFSTKQEMCLIYMFYYTVVTQYGLCRSEIVDQQYMRHYLGVNNRTWDEQQFEFVATSPSHLAGLAMSKISDTQVDWTIRLREELQQDHKNLDQVGICSQNAVGAADAVITTVSFPTNIREYYVPPQMRKCVKRNYY